MAASKTWTRLLGGAIVLPVVLVLGACNNWTMYGGNAAHTGYDWSESAIGASNVGTLVKGEATAPVLGTISSSPTVAAGVLYVTSDNGASIGGGGGAGGTLSAYSADGSTNCSAPRTPTCKPLWQATPGGASHGLSSSPAVDNSLSTPVVYVGSHDGVVYAYNASNGNLLWHSQTLGGSIDGSLTIANGYVYVPEDYGWVYVFPSTTGAGTDQSTDGDDQDCWNGHDVRECGPDWGYSTDGNNYSTPAVANGMIYQAAGDHVGGGDPNDSHQYQLYAFNASYNADQCPGTYAPHESGQPLTDIAACNPAWSAPWHHGGDWDGGGGSPTVADGDVYIESATNGLLAFSADGTGPRCTGTQYEYTGQWGEICTPLWTAPTGNDDGSGGDGSTGPTPAVANGIVYIGGRDVNGNGEVYAFDASSGRQAWSFETGGTIDSSAAIADGVVYVGCSSSPASQKGQPCKANLFALDASNGSQLWTGETAKSIDNPPIIDDEGSQTGVGSVYVGSGHRVFAFTPRPSPRIRR